MGFGFRKSDTLTKRPSWRDYQSRLQQPDLRKRKLRWWVLAAASLVGVGLLYVGVSALIPTAHRGIDALRPATVGASDMAGDSANKSEASHGRLEAQTLLGKSLEGNLTVKEMQVNVADRHFKVVTTLDTNLQEKLTAGLDRKNSRYVAIVVMDPGNGRVLAMVGFDKANPQSNLCLRSIFPAASIFKIVTAAAAVETCGFRADTRLHFRGYKHTLYKSQLNEKIDRWSTEVEFADSFAQSINSVFGSIGIHRLGKDTLQRYAQAFAFNQPIAFELPVEPSRIAIDAEPYHLAEIASGFNNDTTLSPLHGAMIAAAILNEGRMIAPTIVERVSDGEGKLLYAPREQWQSKAISPQTAATMARLMETTVESGTARRTFRGSSKVPALAHLDIGGKTGSISSRDNEVRFDWFVGFAKDRTGSGRLALAVVVGHEKYIGIKSTQYARMAFTQYFNPQADPGAKNTRGHRG
jgi:cell division protein FtsI/penicillin-binding protein 2